MYERERERERLGLDIEVGDIEEDGNKVRNRERKWTEISSSIDVKVNYRQKAKITAEKKMKKWKKK